MSSLEITIQVKRDGIQLDGFPIIRRLEVDELQGFAYEEANDGDDTTFSALPASQLDTIQVLVVKSDQQITLRLDGQSDAGIVLNAGGLLALIDATIDAGAGASNASVNNNSGSTANVEGVAAGT